MPFSLIYPWKRVISVNQGKHNHNTKTEEVLRIDRKGNLEQCGRVSDRFISQRQDKIFGETSRWCGSAQCYIQRGGLALLNKILIVRFCSTCGIFESNDLTGFDHLVLRTESCHTSSRCPI